MGTALAILVFGLPIVLFLAFVGFVRWLLAGTEEPDTRSRHESRRVPLITRLYRWARKPVPKLFYRRDKKGRFRKNRRG